MSTVVICVCESPEAAAQATAQLSERCNAVTLDADQHSIGLAALARASESLERDGASIATFRLPLDELQSRVRDTADGISATPDETPVENAAYADAVVRKYRALHRYCQSVEQELMALLYNWLPQYVPHFAPLGDVPHTVESDGVIEDYQLTRFVGKGNYGHVYTAARADGTVVAVKRVPKAKLMSRSSLGKVCTELRLLLDSDPATRHPNILYLNRVVQTRSHLYFVMPYVRSDVFEFIEASVDNDSGLDEATVLQVATPVLSALKHIHALGYAHRDIKSENILVDFHVDQNVSSLPIIDDVRVIDFDMICETSLAQRGEGHGSLGFMSPEALIKNVPDPTKSDVWSTGCVFLEMRMGRTWFNESWLEPYRQARELRNRSDEAMFHEFKSTLAQTRDNVFHACSTRAGRVIVQNALRINSSTRSSAHDVLAEVERVSASLMPAAANDATEESGSPSPQLESAQLYDARSAEEARLEISSVVSSPVSQYSSSLPSITSSQGSSLGTAAASERRPRDVELSSSDGTEQRNSTSSTTTSQQPFLGLPIQATHEAAPPSHGRAVRQGSASPLSSSPSIYGRRMHRSTTS